MRGRVLLEPYLSPNGRRILVAVTANNRELVRVECGEDELDDFTEYLYRQLEIMPVSDDVAVETVARPPLQLHRAEAG